MKNILKVILMIIFILSMTGCQTQPQKKPEGKQSAKQVEINPELAEKAKQAAMSVKGVEDAVAVVIDKNISTAIKVSGFNRLKLQSIKGEVHKKILLSNDEYEVHVTSDKKLFSQLQQIEKQIKEQKVKSGTELQQKVEKINKDMKG
ncbi:YhcN/YlaJ family sporulation lipoprotein [Desulforamulus putei]|uniref:YhcN/YlaJ family sporulation lipoprotein n=1 Tax=Desulforamulus putei TaxID=74701 RepID=UPI002FDDDDB1